MRLASSFMRAMELNIMRAPWRRSALWKEERFDGIDFVRRCLKAPNSVCGTRGGTFAWPLVKPCVGSGWADTGPCVDFSSVAGPGSWAIDSIVASDMLPLRDLVGLGTVPADGAGGGGLGAALDLTQRRPMPYHTNPMIHLASLKKT